MTGKILRRNTKSKMIESSIKLSMKRKLKRTDSKLNFRLTSKRKENFMRNICKKNDEFKKLIKILF